MHSRVKSAIVYAGIRTHKRSRLVVCSSRKSNSVFCCLSFYNHLLLAFAMVAFPNEPSDTSGSRFSKEKAEDEVPGFAALVGESLKATSLENGMQYSAIYWETGHRTYLPFWATLMQKFSWKVMDDQISSALRLPKPITAEPFVFASQPYIRRYYGDPDISITLPLRSPSHFAFVPTGTQSPWNEALTITEAGPQAAALRGAAATTFRAILESAWKCDIDDYMNMKMQQLARNVHDRKDDSLSSQFSLQPRLPRHGSSGSGFCPVKP